MYKNILPKVANILFLISLFINAYKNIQQCYMCKEKHASSKNCQCWFNSVISYCCFFLFYRLSIEECADMTLLCGYFLKIDYNDKVYKIMWQLFPFIIFITMFVPIELPPLIYISHLVVRVYTRKFIETYWANENQAYF